MLPLLVSNPIHLRYLTGVAVSTGMLIWTPRKTILFVDGRYTEKAKTGARKGVIVRSMDDLDAAVARCKRLRFEAEDVSVARLARWKKRFHGTRLIPATGVIEEMRRVKNDAELKAIKKACNITDQILALIATSLKPKNLTPNTSERSLAWEIEKLAHDLGADGLAFDTIVAFGENTSRPHHAPTQRKLKKGDLVQIDMGVKVNGYCSDCSRVFFTKKPTEEQQRVFDLLLKIVRETTAMTKSDTLTSMLDRHAREELKKHALDKYFLHSLGHGVGLEIHEGVSLTSRKGAKAMRLKENEIITIEPGVYFAGSTSFRRGSAAPRRTPQRGKWGMRIEDTIMVTSNKGYALTKVRY